MKLRVKIQKKFLKYYNDTSKRLGFIPCDITGNIKTNKNKPNPDYDIAYLVIAHTWPSSINQSMINWFGTGELFERRCVENKDGDWQEVPRFISKTK